MTENNFGKKIFFLYPHSVIESDVIHELVKNEYEIYTIKDHKQVKLLLKKYNDSIIYINIDEHLTEQEWFEFISSITSNTELSNVQVGILTYNENEELAAKYLLNLSVSCGFIQLKLGKAESTEIILKTLEVNESKGKRKYIRATTGENNKATFNVKLTGGLATGRINDISSAGMSVIFDDGISVKKNTLLRKIQLKLNGRLLLLDAIVFGSRSLNDKELLTVIMFTNNMTENNKEKIHQYIAEVIQKSMDEEIRLIYNS